MDGLDRRWHSGGRGCRANRRPEAQVEGDRRRKVMNTATEDGREFRRLCREGMLFEVQEWIRAGRAQPAIDLHDRLIPAEIE